MNDVPEDRKTDTGLTPETSILLAYLFVWLGGIVFLAIEKRNRFVRFHAMQSTVFSLLATVVLVLLSILSIIPLLGFLISWIVKPAFIVGFWILIIFMIVKITDGQNIRLPIIADFSDLWLIKLDERKDRK